MPFDVVARPASARRTITMPWAGRNDALLRVQVRCSSGYTEGVAAVGGPKLLTVGGAAKVRQQTSTARVLAETPAEPAADPLAARLANLLRALAAAKADLPSMNSIAGSLDVASNTVRTVLNRMSRRGEILHWWAGTGPRPQRIIRLLADHVELRTPDAPVDVLPPWGGAPTPG